VAVITSIQDGCGVQAKTILQAHKTGRSTYGSTGIQQELSEQEVYVGQDRIHRLGKKLGLRRVGASACPEQLAKAGWGQTSRQPFELCLSALS
jgi:hypothetical protein